MLASPERVLRPEEKREALDMVLRSQTFARAGQLKKFLRYICEMEEAGRSDEITEYSIGTDALGRPRDYSPAADSGVRGRAHDLRQKLAQFYDLEAPGAKFRIGLRRGSYTPFFYEAEPVEGIQHPLPDPRAHRRKLFLRSVVVSAMLVVAAVVATRAFYVQKTGLDPIVEEFWGPLVHRGSDVLLCLATPPSLLMKPYSIPPDPDVFRPLLADGSRWYSRLKIPETGGQLYMYYSGDSPLFGDAEAAIFASRIISTAGASVNLLPENSVQPAALRNQNVLLVGSPNYSDYAARIMRNTPFTISEDNTLHEEVIRERSPHGETVKAFIPKRDDSRSLVLVYGLITVFPNQTLSDRYSRIIIVSGVTGAGSGAAMHFFASAAGLSTLRDRFRRDGLKQVPSAYQVVVKASRDKAVALGWELADYKIMQHPPTLD